MNLRYLIGHLVLLSANKNYIDQTNAQNHICSILSFSWIVIHYEILLPWSPQTKIAGFASDENKLRSQSNVCNKNT